MHVEFVMGNCWRSGAKLWHSPVVLEHTEEIDFKLWGWWICGVEWYSLVWDLFIFFNLFWLLIRPSPAFQVLPMDAQADGKIFH